MEESILRTIKPMINVEPDDHNFDSSILVGINSAFSTLLQVGIGVASDLENPSGNTESIRSLHVRDDTAMWSSLNAGSALGMVQEYVYIKTLLVFDPPSNPSVLKALDEESNELIWRIDAKLTA